jgi:hypothetical protein
MLYINGYGIDAFRIMPSRAIPPICIIPFTGGFTMATFAQFISADLGNASARHAIRMEALTKAVVMAMRGNKSELIEAQGFVLTQKGKIAKAYVAGFEALGNVARHAYTGKLTADVSATIDAMAKEKAEVFGKAFIEVSPLEVAEKTEEEKAKAKADKEAKAEKAFKEKASELGYVKADELTEADALTLALSLVNRLDVAQLEALTLQASARLDTIKGKADKKASRKSASKAEVKAEETTGNTVEA